MTNEVEQALEVQAEPADLALTDSAPVVVEPISLAVSASTSHIYGLIEHLKSEFLMLEEKFNKAIADLRSHL